MDQTSARAFPHLVLATPCSQAAQLIIQSSLPFTKSSCYHPAIKWCRSKRKEKLADTLIICPQEEQINRRPIYIKESIPEWAFTPKYDWTKVLTQYIHQEIHNHQEDQVLQCLDAERYYKIKLGSPHIQNATPTFFTTMMHFLLEVLTQLVWYIYYISVWYIFHI